MKLLQFVPYVHHCNTALSLSATPKIQLFYELQNQGPQQKIPEASLSCHHSLLTDLGFAASNLMQRCSNRTSQALKHVTGKGRTAPHTKRSHGSSQQETNTLMPKKSESASSITSQLPRTYGRVKNLSWEKAWLLPPWSCQGLDCSPTTPLRHISQTLHLPSSSSLHHT